MDDEDDDYISYGTSLPDIEEESVLRKKAARELEVRDEKGRQRFHGAFTGGFSAGYFNTVGTKEGWAPSTFVSSRDKKYKDDVLQNPEDFMDEEDFGEFGIATRRIHTTSKFQDSSDSRPKKRTFAEIDSVIPGEAPLKDIVRPIKDSIGIEILKKLGWKLGQGIGPRIKKPHSSVKVYGCSPFPRADELEEDDPFSQSYTFAPEDTEAEIYRPKDDVFGIGYSGLSKESVLSARIDAFNPTTTKSFLKKDKKKLTISGQAFGVGAFEDDDADIYSKDDMSQYDFSDLDNKEPPQSSRDCRTGQLLDSSAIIEGFRMASQPTAVKKYYPPPDLPPNFRPIRLSMSKVICQPEPQFKSRHSMSSEDRSMLLGERKFKPFQLTSEKKTVEVKSYLKNVNNSFPNSKHSFRPFPNDDIKQKRYEEYVKLKNLGETEKLVQPSSMTEWEKQQELEEFARAAILFKPLSAALSSKFESRSHLSVEHEVMEELAKARKESTKKVVEKRKLVGLSNRKTSEWHPASLLCKRFNVPNPYPNSSEVSGASKSKSLFDHISFNNKQEEKNHPSSSSFPEAVDEKVPIPVESLVENTPKGNDVASDRTIKEKPISQDQLPESGRPPIDFFKDIFENSSDDDSPQPEPIQDSTKTESSQNPVEDPATSSEVDVPNKKLVIENKKAGFGVFANIDLDALNQRTPKVQSSSQDFGIKCETIDISESPVHDGKNLNDNVQLADLNSSLSSDLYGPDLPPNYSELSTRKAPKLEHMKHSKHKVKHKHKHHKHKGKKKKKKRSSHKSSEDSSFDSDEDIPPTVILEKLKKLQSVMK